jgi:hypothetical protein
MDEEFLQLYVNEQDLTSQVVNLAFKADPNVAKIISFQEPAVADVAIAFKGCVSTFSFEF